MSDKERQKAIKSNVIMCKRCNDVIESRHRHDFKFCKCNTVAVDGGKDYLRRVGPFDMIEDLSTFYD